MGPHSRRRCLVSKLENSSDFTVEFWRVFMITSCRHTERPSPWRFPCPLCHVPRAVTQVPRDPQPSLPSFCHPPTRSQGSRGLDPVTAQKGLLTHLRGRFCGSFLSFTCSFTKTEGGESESTTDISEKNELDTCTPYDKALWARHTFGQAAPELRIWVCKQVNSCYLRL